MNYKKTIAGLCLFGGMLAFAGFINHNNDPIPKIAAQLDKWALNYPPEKVYLQFDKPYYAVGDDIWFKAYVTLGSRHQLSALGGTLDVELIDDRDSVKQHIKLPMANGITWGDFALADTMAEGNYRIRAYTHYMRNAGEDYFFDKNIVIVNAITNKVFTKADFNYTSLNGQQKVNTQINYFDLSGAPYANKEVKYAVELNDKSVARGKGITDDKGNINLSFSAAQAPMPKPGRITTSIKIDEKNTVNKEILVKAASSTVDVQFFPEGGSLVNGFISKIAFKAVGADGLGKEIRGIVFDDKNDTVTTLASRHLGMGAFSFTPQAGKLYKALITFADGSAKTFDLPLAGDKGYALSIYDSDADHIGINISSSRGVTDANAADTLSLVAQQGGEIFYAAKTNPGTAYFSALVAKKRFPSGIVQFTLFSSKGEPLNQRLVFIQNQDQLKLELRPDKNDFAPHQKVKFNFSAKNDSAKAAIGSFSVAVTDETKVPVDESDETTILSSLLLTSDLRGYVEKPNYYFNHVSDATRADLDVLMLTQGYHRFEWKKIMDDDFPAMAFEPEKDIEITGHIKTLGGKPVMNGKVTLLSTAGGMFFVDTLTDANGKFVFKNLVFKDSVRFVIQARTGKDGKNVQIDLDNITPQAVGTDKNAPGMQVSVNDGLSAYLQSSNTLYSEQLRYGMGNHIIALKEVVIKYKREVIKNSTNLNGAGNADQVLTSKDLTMGCPTLQACLEGKLTGVYFKGLPPEQKPYLMRGSGGSQPMAIQVDGANMPDALDILNIEEVASIEVLRSASYTAVYGSEGSGGMILITTKRGGEGGYSRPAPGIITYAPKGYYKTREFYSPQYDDPKTNTSLADLRSTIYWNPNLITDKDGNSTFDYFNAGSKGTYRVVVEGIDVDGNLGRQVFEYKVQ